MDVEELVQRRTAEQFGTRILVIATGFPVQRLRELILASATHATNCPQGAVVLIAHCELYRQAVVLADGTAQELAALLKAGVMGYRLNATGHPYWRCGCRKRSTSSAAVDAFVFDVRPLNHQAVSMMGIRRGLSKSLYRDLTEGRRRDGLRSSILEGAMQPRRFATKPSADCRRQLNAGDPQWNIERHYQGVPPVAAQGVLDAAAVRAKKPLTIRHRAPPTASRRAPQPGLAHVYDEGLAHVYGRASCKSAAWPRARLLQCAGRRAPPTASRRAPRPGLAHVYDDGLAHVYGRASCKSVAWPRARLLQGAGRRAPLTAARRAPRPGLALVYDDGLAHVYDRASCKPAAWPRARLLQCAGRRAPPTALRRAPRPGLAHVSDMASRTSTTGPRASLRHSLVQGYCSARTTPPATRAPNPCHVCKIEGANDRGRYPTAGNMTAVAPL